MASVVIPTWNQSARLASALASLANQTRPPDEVIVVDNGSTDDALAVARRAGARVLEMGANLGFAAAVNQGILASRCEWIAVLNNDVELDSQWLEQIRRAAEQSGAWFATGKLLQMENPRLLDGTWDELARSGCAWRSGANRPDGPPWHRERDIQFAPFTAILVRRELFERVGLLDETLGSYLEDVEFGLRCAVAGYGGRYVPAAVAYHAGSATLGQWHREMVRLMARNQLLILARHYPRRLLWRWAWAILAGQALWGLVAASHGQGLAFCLGKWQALRQFRRVRQQARFHPQVEQILTRSEERIYRLQQATGFDRYWKWYFRLVWKSAR